MVQVAAHAKHAIQAALDRHAVFALCGPPGCGKKTILKQMGYDHNGATEQVEQLRFFTGGSAMDWRITAAKGAAVDTVEELDEQSSEEALAPTGGCMGYFVVHTEKKKIRRLHYGVRCPVQPGLTCRDWKVYGETLPAVDNYDFVCKRCWPKDTFERPGA